MHYLSQKSRLFDQILEFSPSAAQELHMNNAAKASPKKYLKTST